MRHQNQTTTLAVDEVTTARKPVEVALNESRRYLRALFDNSLDAILVANDEGRYIDANPAACAQLGYSREELVRLSVLDLTAPAFREEGWAMWKQFLARGSDCGEYSVLRKDGAVLQVEFRAVANILPGVHISSSHDVTERKRAEAALRESEERLRAIFDTEPECVKLLAADGSLLNMNPAGLRMIEADSIQQVENRCVYPLIVEEHRAAFRSLTERVFRGESGELEFQIIGLKGGQRWLETHAAPLRDDEGNVISLLGITRDVTERKREDQAKRESQEQYESLVHSIDGIVWEADPETFTFTFVSKQAEKILGYPLERWFEGPSFWPDHMHPEDRDWAVSYCVNYTNRREDHQFEYRMIAADGHVVWLSDFVTVHVADDQSVLLRGVMVDITERKLMEEKLKQSESLLGEAQRTAHIGSWSWDLNSETQIWSDELYRIYKLQPGEVAPTYEAFLELVHPEDRLQLDESVELASRTREPIDLYFRIIRADGEERIIHSRGRIVYDDQGNPIRRYGTAQDVTEYRRAEEALRAAEQKYRDIFENALEGIFQTTPDGRFIAANPALVKMFGFGSAEELIRERSDISNQHYVDPKCREEFKRKLDAQGVVKGFEFQAYRKDGSTIWLSENVRAVRDERGEVLYYEGTTQDITERRLANQSLRLFRTLIDQSSDAIEVIDQDTFRFLDCNESAYRTLGYNREEFLSLNVFDIDPLVDRSMIAGLDEEMDKSGFATLESIHRRKDGSTFPVEINVKVVRLERNYRLAVVRDITERKRAENSLQESEERFRQLSEAAFEAIIVYDQGTILEVNQSFCRMYGYERAEVRGKSVLDLALPEFRELLLQRVRSGDTDSYEGPALRKDGTTFTAEVAGKPIHYQGRVVRVAAIRDITEQKRNERRQAAQYAVTRVLTESATLANAVPQLLQAICESLRWKMGEFWRVCDSTNLLRCVETWHVPGLDATSFIEASRQTELAPGVGLPGRVWQSGQPEWIPDVMTDPRFPRASIAAKVGLRGAVAFPILLGNHTLGVMQFFSRRAPEVDEDLLKIMSAIGSQIGQFTERKRAEEALTQAEDKYRGIFENAELGIFQTTPDGKTLTANPALARMLGFDSPEDLISERTDIAQQEYVDPAQREEFKRLLNEHDVVQRFDYEAYRKDGSKIWLSGNVRAVRGDQGNVLYYEGTTQDINERKRHEEALRASEQELRLFNLATNDMFWNWNFATDTVVRSMGFERVFGYSEVEINPSISWWEERLHPDDNERVLTQFRTALQRGDKTCSYEYRFRRHNGSYATISDRAYIVRDESGNAVRAMGAMTDITERKRADEKLQNSEKYFRSLIENASDLITICDGNGIIRYESPSLERMLGYKPDERMGKSVLDLLHPDDLQFAKRHFAKGIRNPGIVQIMECRFQHKDGSWHLVETTGINLLDDPVVAGIVVNSRDITERKRAEEAWRNAERKYRDIFENAGEGIFQSTPDGKYITANPALARIYGFESPEELIRSREDISRQTYVDPTRRDEFKRQLKEQGAIRGFESQAFRKDGSKFWISLNARAVRNEQGVIEYYEGTTHDINERKRAEDLLRESEERYRELFENAKDATYVHDLSGKYRSVNRATEKLSGYTRNEILGKSFSDFVAPEQAEHIRKQLCSKLVDEGETSYESEVITKDGRRVAVEICSHLILENGVPVGVQGTARDITDRKLATEALSRAAAIVESSDEAIISKTLDGIITSWNKSAARIYGYSSEEVIGRPVSSLIPPECADELPEIMEKVRRGETVEHFETLRIRKDGRRIYVSLSVSPIRDAAGTVIGASAIARNITERKLAEEKLKTTSEQLRALSARLRSAREEEGTRIAREIHDELGSVLTGLKWDIEGAEAILAGPMYPSQLTALREKLQALMKLSDVAIGSIRRIASELRPSVLDDLGLAAAIEWQAQQFQARTGIICDCSLKTLDLSQQQSTALFRILQEALTNVLRHAQATRVDIELSIENGSFVLSVSDNGKGITESAESEQQSLGILGMRERAHLIGGEIDIKGREGKGTVVIVRVPISGDDRVLKMTS